jgi:hypothetical protein
MSEEATSRSTADGDIAEEDYAADEATPADTVLTTPDEKILIHGPGEESRISE